MGRDRDKGELGVLGVADGFGDKEVSDEGRRGACGTVAVCINWVPEIILKVKRMSLHVQKTAYVDEYVYPGKTRPAAFDQY